MSLEINQLRQALQASDSGSASAIAKDAHDAVNEDMASTASQQRSSAAVAELISSSIPTNSVPNTRDEAMLSLDWRFEGSHGSDQVISPMADLPLLLPQALATNSASNTTFQAASNISLTLGQAKELFKMYFTLSHQYLPFRMTSTAPEHVYSNNRLLFWAICAVNASWPLRARLQPMVKSMVADSLSSVLQTFEDVQAPLILSLWPFPVSSLNEDPSYYYSGLAWQMSLQIGLHRPLEIHSHQYGSENNTKTELEEVKLSTWLASFIVNNLHASYRGVPPTVLVDIHLLNAMENPVVDSRLSQLCRITHLLMQATLELSANNPTSSGMLEPEARLSMIKLYGERFARLQTQILDQADDTVKIAFLSSRAQLWSFALLNDMAFSADLKDCIEHARSDATALIGVCYGKNLAVAPYHVRRALCFGAFILIRVLKSQPLTDPEVIEDMIERTCLLLEINPSSASPSDLVRKACQIIRALQKMNDRRLRPPILSRMGASLVHDSLRIWVENEYYDNSQHNHADASLATLDLDGFDWTALGPFF